mmetsp:Transcript_89417/g.139980  ORF Transcript_89417/g.139980 Transcript_89417/m.139980 type:complete len:261 (-) Transcript_89417:120-902(-)
MRYGPVFPIAPTKSNVAFYPHSSRIFEWAWPSSIKLNREVQLRWRIEWLTSLYCCAMQDSQPTRSFMRSWHGLMSHRQIIDNDYVSLLPLVIVTDVIAIHQLCPPLEKLIHLLVVPRLYASKLISFAGFSDSLNYGACHPCVQIQRLASANVVLVHHRVYNATIGVDTRTFLITLLELWRQSIKGLSKVSECRIPRTCRRFHNVIYYMAKHIALERTIIVPFRSDLVESMILIIGQPEDITIRALVMISMGRVKSAWSKR